MDLMGHDGFVGSRRLRNRGDMRSLRNLLWMVLLAGAFIGPLLFVGQVLANDWLAIRIDARDHVFDVDLLGESQTNHNLEFTGGLSIFF